MKYKPYIDSWRNIKYNKTRHSYIYILRIAGQTAGPIGLIFFCDHSWVGGGCYRLKKIDFFQKIFTANARPFS